MEIPWRLLRTGGRAPAGRVRRAVRRARSSTIVPVPAGPRNRGAGGRSTCATASLGPCWGRSRSDRWPWWPPAAGRDRPPPHVDDHGGDILAARRPGCRASPLRGRRPRYNKVGVIKVGPASAKNVLVLEPGHLGRQPPTSCRWPSGSCPRPGLAGVVGRAPGEPARGPVGAEPLQGGQGHRHPALRLLPRLPEGPEHHPPLPARPELDGGVRQAVGDERRRPGPAHRDRGGQEARGQGRARRPLARRRGGHRLRHLGLQRPAPGPTSWPASSTSTAAAAPSPDQRPARPRQALQALDAPDGLPLAGLRRHRRPLRRHLRAPPGRRPRCSDPNAPSLGQTSGLLPADIVPPVPVTNLGQYGYALERRHLAAEPAGGPGAIWAQGSRPPGRSTAGTAPGALTPIDRFATMFSGDGMHERRRHRVVLPPAPDRRHRRPSTTATPTRPRRCSASTPPWATTSRRTC